MKEGDRRNKENEGRGYGREDGDVLLLRDVHLFLRVRLPDKGAKYSQGEKTVGQG